MAWFSNILVGVDLSHGDWRADADGDTPSHNAFDLAVALASKSDAKLHLLAALDLDARTQRLLKECEGVETSVVDTASEALRHLTNEASTKDVTCDSTVALGKGWVAINERAKEKGHDLVILGSRKHSMIGSLLLGSTNVHVLQAAPCPVWIVRPRTEDIPKSILVATDFSPACNALLDMAAEIAGMFGSKLHVVHSVELPGRSFLSFGNVASEALDAAHQTAVDEAKTKLDELNSRPSVAALSTAPTLHLEQGNPSEIVLGLVKSLDIDLLAMGTVAWSGVTGMMFGSTAQTLMSQLDCSLLSIRPEVLAKG